jgi:hypothetical protein
VIIHRKGDCDVLGGSENRFQGSFVGYFLVSAPHMEGHKKEASRLQPINLGEKFTLFFFFSL